MTRAAVDAAAVETLPKLCQELGCSRQATEWFVSWAADDPKAHFWYCDEHASQAEFCVVCGEFYGGTEEFFRSGIQGICCDCARMDEFDPDNWDDEDDDEPY